MGKGEGVKGKLEESLNPRFRLILLTERSPMNSKIRTFEDLIVWQKAIAFVKQVYLITDEGGLKRDFGLKDQLRGLPFRSRQILPKDSRDRREKSIGYF